LAFAPESALKALTLGNEKYALEKTLEGSPVAIVVADPAIGVPVADLFGLDESKLVIMRPEGEFGSDASLAVQNDDLTAPLVVVLGLNEDAVWAAYEATLQASPALIHAVLKSQVSALGAVLDPESGSVKILGAHPDLQTLVGQYLLGTPAEVAPEAQALTETAVETETTAQTEPAAEEQHDAVNEAAHEEPAALHQEAAEEAGHAPKAKTPAEQSGGSDFLIVLLFVAALVGVVVFMDKTVLKS
jgi:hypothetical protein